jgi:tetratricopeptide (TPR) repeat protein
MNEKQKARAGFEEARTLLEEEVAKQPNDPRMHSSLGIAYAALGSKDKALEHGRKATELLPYEDNPLYGVCFVQDLAIIYIMIGDYDAALDQIEFMLSVDSWMTFPYLEINPYWERLEEHPRYKSLAEKHSYN